MSNHGYDAAIVMFLCELIWLKALYNFNQFDQVIFVSTFQDIPFHSLTNVHVFKHFWTKKETIKHKYKTLLYQVFCLLTEC